MGIVGRAVMGILLCFTGGYSLPQPQTSLTPTTTEFSLNPSIGARFSEVKCIVNGQEGKCVHESYCNEGHTLMPGGIIDESEFRERTTTKACAREFHWCCIQEVEEPKVETKADIACTSPKTDTCPWCVSLYKSGKLQITKTGLFCMGAMIGSQVILTAATCVKAAQKQMLWARVPSSAEPTRNYTVQYRSFNPEYNTGSHVNDFGLLVLEENVKWENDNWKGACLGFQAPKANVCFAFGFDSDENYESTMLTTQAGSCSRGGNGPDAMCGSLYDSDDNCFVTIGSPVLCSVQGEYLLTGVARTSCISRDKALLGSLMPSDDWLETSLKDVGLKESQYKFGGPTSFTPRSKSK